VSGQILLVEDDDAVATSLSRLLRAAGHPCTRVADAEQAIQYLTRDLPRFIVSDLNMPGMDGMSFLKRVRADARTLAVPFVIYTASCDLDREDDFLQAGATACCSKYEPEELLRLIAEIR
jgi:two-component system, OmpR family, phosphate regulon response regulator PhoB